MRTVNIIFPVQNDECLLIRGIRKTSDFCEKYFAGRYQITIADIGSTDETEAMGRAIARTCERVNYIKSDGGTADSVLRAALLENTCEIVGFMDIDLSAGLEHLLGVDYAFQEKKIGAVNGLRFRRNSLVNVSSSRWKTARAFQSVMKFVLKVQAGDAFSRFKFFRSSMIEELIPLSQNSQCWYFCAELLLRAERKGIRVQELTVDWKEDTVCRSGIWKSIWEYWKQLIHLLRSLPKL